MRILYVTEASGSGTFEMVRTIADGAVQAGHDVCVALGHRPETPEDVSAQFTEGVEVVTLPWTSRRPREQLRAGRALRALVHRWRPNVVHLHSAFAGVVGAASLPRGIPLVYTPHGSPVTRHSDSAGRRLAYRAVERLVARRATVVAAVSNAEADVIARALRPRTLRVVPNGISDLDPGGEPGAAPRPARPLVVVVGRVTAQRCPAETAAILAGVCDLADVLWIGASADGADGPLRAAGIEMTGWLPREAALERLAQASVVIHWSAWDGLSLALLEALARDVIVVASDIPANAEVVGPRQVVATVAAATALARRILLEPVLAFELLGEQRVRRRRYGARRCVEEWLALYADCGAPGRARALS